VRGEHIPARSDPALAGFLTFRLRGRPNSVHLGRRLSNGGGEMRCSH
jgi:hypothetical protein